MEQSCLEIGKIVNTHGLKGEVKVVPWADYPEIFEEIDYVIDYQKNKHKIEFVKYHKSSVILKLENISSVDEALKYKNTILLAKKESLSKLPENTYYIADLIGLEVYCKSEFLGKISDVSQYGSADIYTIKKQGQKDILLPALKETILEVDLEKKLMKVELLDGLLDL